MATHGDDSRSQIWRIDRRLDRGNRLGAHRSCPTRPGLFAVADLSRMGVIRQAAGTGKSLTY
jgi:hypothetical protein